MRTSKPQRLDHDHDGSSGRARARYVTVLGGIRPYQRSLLPTDVVAGITLAALAIPEVMGYTQIAGTPVITGLYTILVPAIAATQRRPPSCTQASPRSGSPA